MVGLWAGMATLQIFPQLVIATCGSMCDCWMLMHSIP
jgi:hypothetical protein